LLQGLLAGIGDLGRNAGPIADFTALLLPCLLSLHDRLSQEEVLHLKPENISKQYDQPLPILYSFVVVFLHAHCRLLWAHESRIVVLRVIIQVSPAFIHADARPFIYCFTQSSLIIHSLIGFI
jgi:hypothetical protein